MKGQVENNYEARAEMNQKSSLMLKRLRLLHESDLVVLSADFYKPVKLNPGIEHLKSDVHELGHQIKGIQEDIKTINHKMDTELSEIKTMLGELLKK